MSLLTYLGPESAPFCVDDDVLGVALVSVPGVDPVNVLEVAGIGPSPDDHSNPTLWVLPSTGHEASRGVIQDGAHLDIDITSPGQSLSQQLDNILPLHSGTFETFGPVGQFAHSQPFLLAGEAECEAKWKTLRLVSNIPVRDKVSQTLGDVIKQLMTRALHDLLRDGVHLGVHRELLVRLNVNHENTKVCPPQVQS